MKLGAIGGHKSDGSAKGGIAKLIGGLPFLLLALGAWAVALAGNNITPPLLNRTKSAIHQSVVPCAVSICHCVHRSIAEAAQRRDGAFEFSALSPNRHTTPRRRWTYRDCTASHRTSYITILEISDIKSCVFCRSCGHAPSGSVHRSAPPVIVSSI